MYQSWIADQEEEHKKYKDYSTYLGAFFNYEMAKNVMDEDSKKVKASSDKDFEESVRMMEEYKKIESSNESSAKRKNRKVIR